MSRTRLAVGQRLPADFDDGHPADEAWQVVPVGGSVQAGWDTVSRCAPFVACPPAALVGGGWRCACSGSSGASRWCRGRLHAVRRGGSRGRRAVLALLRQRPAAVVAAVLAAGSSPWRRGRSAGERPFGEPGRAARGQREHAVRDRLRRGARALVRRVARSVLSVQELTPALAARLDAAGLAELMPERCSTRPDAAGIGLCSRVPLAALASPSAENPLRRPPRPRARRGRSPRCTRRRRCAPARSPWRADLRGSARDAGRRCACWRATSTPRSTTPSCGGCSTAATSTRRPRSAPGLECTWPDGRGPPPVTIDHVLADERAGAGGLDPRDQRHRPPGRRRRARRSSTSIPPPARAGVAPTDAAPSSPPGSVSASPLPTDRRGPHSSSPTSPPGGLTPGV